MVYRIASLAALLLCCAQCAGAGAPSQAVLPGAASLTRQPFLYVGGAELSQYALGSSKPLHTVNLSLGASAIALNGRGNLFLANGGVSEGYIAVYDAQSLNLLRSEQLTDDTFLADRTAAPARRPRSSYRLRRIGYRPRRPPWRVTGEISQPAALAVDSKGTLYVASAPVGFKEHNSGCVTVYSAGATKPLRKIVAGIDRQLALVLDSSDRLYVADGGKSAVTVYSAGGAKLLQTITDGIRVAEALAIH